MMTKKLRLIGSGNDKKRNFFILNKEKSFFSLFPLFLISCGFKNIKEYEDYQEEKPDIDEFTNRVEHFKNQEYDIDLIYTQNRIILIIRTEEKNRDNLISGIKRIADF